MFFGKVSWDIFLWLPPGMFPDVTGHLLCFCLAGGFLGRWIG